MAFVQVGAAPILKLDNYNEGDVVVEGIYVGSFESKFGQPAFKFRDAQGMVKAVACGSMKYKMQDVEKGALCRVIYCGKGVLQNGTFKGKTFHEVEVLVDDPSLDAATTEETEDGVF